MRNQASDKKMTLNVRNCQSARIPINKFTISDAVGK